MRSVRATREVRARACGPSCAACRELLADMRKSPVRTRIEENDAGEHIRMAHDANARWHLASEAKAAAETNDVFGAAAPLYKPIQWRARPPSERARRR